MLPWLLLHEELQRDIAFNKREVPWRIAKQFISDCPAGLLSHLLCILDLRSGSQYNISHPIALIFSWSLSFSLSHAKGLPLTNKNVNTVILALGYAFKKNQAKIIGIKPGILKMNRQEIIVSEYIYSWTSNSGEVDGKCCMFMVIKVNSAWTTWLENPGSCRNGKWRLTWPLINIFC